MLVLPKRSFFNLVLCGVLLGTAVPAAMPAYAQDSSLAQELDRIRRDVRDLQRTVFAGEEPPEGAVDSIESANATAMARTQLKIQALENRVRDLTGQIEEVRFHVDSVTTRLDKLISDVDYRLQALESGTATSGAQTGQSQFGQSRVGQASVTQTDGQGTTIISSTGEQVEQIDSLQPGQQSLGQLSANASGQIAASQNTAQTSIESSAFQQQADVADEPRAVPVTGSVVEGNQQSAALALGELPEGSPKEQYDYAFNLLRDRNFPAAEAALKTFLAQNESGPLAANAMYWLGESHYARQDFRSAAAVFVDAYTDFPNGSKASHSLLKLGMSLGALGKTKEACIAFQELKTKFPNAGDRVLNRAETEAAKVGCS
ncbi:MAG: tol-pal system protein YbgF [Alphaproteobacteria bacterium]